MDFDDLFFTSFILHVCIVINYNYELMNSYYVLAPLHAGLLPSCVKSSKQFYKAQASERLNNPLVSLLFL